MAKSTGRRGYNAYIRKAKKRFGITHTQARKMYRLQSEKVGGPINSRELDKHPIVSKRLAVEASKPVKKSTGKRSVPSTHKPGRARPSGAESPGQRRPEAPKKRARTIREWELWYDTAYEYEDLIVEAGVDTGRRKGRR